MTQIRIYNPKRKPKIKPLFTGLGNFIFPVEELGRPEYLIVGGELDALTTIQHGFHAITGTTGEKASWTKNDLSVFAGTTAYIWLDNDKDGRLGTLTRAVELTEAGANVLIVSHPPGRPDGADINDWFGKEKRGAKEFRKQLQAAKPFDPWDFASFPGIERRIRQRAQEQFISEEARLQRAAASFISPTWYTSVAEEPAIEEEEEWVYLGLHPDGSNTLIPSLPGVGKTTLMLNAVRSRTDEDVKFLGYGVPLLGEGERVGILNWEMMPKQIRGWARKIGIAEDRLSILDLRDDSYPLISPACQEDFIAWCLNANIKDLWIDSRRDLMGASQMSELSNDDATRMTRTLSELKKKAGIRNLFMNAHTPRPLRKSDGTEIQQERPMGAVHWDSWPDNIWFYGNDGGSHFLVPTRVRGGNHPEGWSIGVLWDESTYRLFASGRTRQQERDRREKKEERKLVGGVVLYVAKHPGCTANAIEEAVTGKNTDIRKARRFAIDRKVLEVEPGPNNSQHHYITSRGKRWLDKK